MAWLAGLACVATIRPQSACLPACPPPPPGQFIAEADGSLVQLGEGAHGVVYLAKMQELYVAVKVRPAATTERT